tara:strand:+ start:1233 stop:1391 length:159 start_codon:yes stop_codon:yes gene_type:complete
MFFPHFPAPLAQQQNRQLWAILADIAKPITDSLQFVVLSATAPDSCYALLTY